MKDTAYAPVCGIYCGACPFLGQQCPGCGVVDGRPFWTAGMPNGVCPLHDCCRHRKQLEHCGLCSAFPCQTFAELRDPSMTDEQFAESLNARKAALKTRSEIGTEAWLQQRTGGRVEGGLRDLPNVGPVLERSLREVGIETPEDLRSVGAREAFVRIRATVDSGACLHMLYGLEGAVRGIPDKLLLDDVKRGLRDFCRSLDAGRLPLKGGKVERGNVTPAGGE